ncbi:MAG: DNA topoisomerase 3 [Paludibacteraceae bacterium]|nr:DNA topoisomerase 3 [Paludibacteraceae bacterium]
MKVILTEKPSVAKDIARVLQITGKKDGYLEGRGCQITWAFGHLIELAKPDHYGYKQWNLQDLPIVPQTFVYLPTGDEGAKKQLNTIVTLFRDAEEIICATDAGREGEAIFRYIYNESKCNKPFRRLWISSMTDAAILDGFKNLKPGAEYDDLYASARARNEADWLVGMNASRALTLGSNSRTALSLGRVQTPTLALICKRYLEHEAFVPSAFYTLQATLSYGGQSFKARSAERFQDRTQAEALLAQIGAQVQTIDKQKKVKTEKAPLPYDLTSLQADANRRYGFSAQRTLDLMQGLYERYKVLTYPRTGSRYLGDDMVADLKKQVPLLAGLPYGEKLKPALDTLAQKGLNKAPFDSKKLTDHHAIIPTFHGIDKIGMLPADERKIFDMVCLQLLMALLPPCKKEVLTYKFDYAEGREPLTSVGSKIQTAGWRLLQMTDDKSETDDEEDDSQLLPDIPKNAPVDVEGKEIKEGMTKKPPLLTEASLLKSMETAGRQLTDPEAVEAMKDCGLGTPATRASIIETLFKRKFIISDKKKLLPTPLGLQIYQLTKDAPIGNPAMTGDWERKLNLMAVHKYDSRQFANEIIEFTRAEVERLIQTSGQIKTGQASDYCCPLCGNRLRENEKAYGCSRRNPDCNFVIWKQIGGVGIDLEQLGKIVSRGYSDRLSGFTGKEGKKFDARIGYDPETGRSRYVFNPVIGHCPTCGKDVVEGMRGYGCMGYKEGCKFVVWKEISGRSIDIETAQQLLKDGQTPVLDGFTSRDGKPFSAALRIKDGQVQFVFAERQGDQAPPTSATDGQ